MASNKIAGLTFQLKANARQLNATIKGTNQRLLGLQKAASRMGSVLMASFGGLALLNSIRSGARVLVEFGDQMARVRAIGMTTSNTSLVESEHPTKYSIGRLSREIKWHPTYLVNCCGAF